MTEEAPDPVERLAHVVRHAEARLSDTQRARGALALVECLRREASGAPVKSATPHRRRKAVAWSVGLAAAAALLVSYLSRREQPPVHIDRPMASRVVEQHVATIETAASDSTLAILRPVNHGGGEAGYSRLEASAGVSLRALLADCGRLVLQAGAALAVEENATSGIVLRLERGTVLVSFDHDSGRSLAVRTRDALVRVTGTVFAVATSESPTRVSVWRGSVEVVTGALPVSVAAGKSWQVGAVSLGVPDSSTALTLRELRALDTPGAATESPRPPRAGSPKVEAPSREKSRPAAANESPAPRSDESSERAAESIYRMAERALATGRTEVAKGLLESLVANHAQDPLVAPATYELARLSLAAQDYVQAREQLRRVLANQSAGAASFKEPASFLLCRTELDLGAEASTQSCLERFRAEFPASPHSGDALALLALLRMRDKDCETGRALAEDYLQRYPNGAHTGRLRQGIERCR